jgi:gamma-glutamylcyclotransferase (GGCT)/AIG2-like uncharacterized protein YtfP
MNVHIFTYGSLMFPQVWQSVVRRQYRSVPAILAGYSRFAIAGETYPGMVAQSGGSVRGVVYFDVDADDTAALDMFEGHQYRRDSVTAQLESGASLPVDTYVYLAPQNLSDRSWQPETFQLQRFLESCCSDKLRN